MGDDTFYADFPCLEAAKKFKSYIGKKGYFCYLVQMYTGIFNNEKYRVLYWKGENNEPEN